MREVLVGSESVARSLVTSYELRRWYRRIFHDVYVPRHYEPTLRDYTVGAWLWSRRRAVIAGVAASALHGASWVDAATPVELIWHRSRPQPGLIVRQEVIDDDEITKVAGLSVTTPARTAYDLGRHLPRGQALARLDALMRSTPFAVEDVLLLAKRYESARGIRQLRELLPLVDGGAASPKESWLRLLLIDAGFPKPTTQIPVTDGWKLIAMLDMGWEEFKVSAEYDGDQHRTDRKTYVKDQRRMPKVAEKGWKVIRVIKEDRGDDVVKRVDDALVARGWTPQPAARRSRRSSATSSSSKGGNSPTTRDKSRSASPGLRARQGPCM